MPNRKIFILAAIMSSLVLASCGGSDSDELMERYTPLSLENSANMQVNGYLWQASLDTLSFMPMISTDAAGGVIISDWYSHPSSPNERTKVRVDILDPRLRSDALRVSVTRQIQAANSGWVNVPVQQTTVASLEDAILIQARQIRIRTITAD